MEWLESNYANLAAIFAAWSGVLAVLQVLVRFTPTTKDDTVLATFGAWVQRVRHLLFRAGRRRTRRAGRWPRRARRRARWRGSAPARAARWGRRPAAPAWGLLRAGAFIFGGFIGLLEN